MQAEGSTGREVAHRPKRGSQATRDVLAEKRHTGRRGTQAIQGIAAHRPKGGTTLERALGDSRVVDRSPGKRSPCSRKIRHHSALRAQKVLLNHSIKRRLEYRCSVPKLGAAKRVSRAGNDAGISRSPISYDSFGAEKSRPCGTKRGASPQCKVGWRKEAHGPRRGTLAEKRHTGREGAQRPRSDTQERATQEATSCGEEAHRPQRGPVLASSGPDGVNPPHSPPIGPRSVGRKIPVPDGPHSKRLATSNSSPPPPSCP